MLVTIHRLQNRLVNWVARTLPLNSNSQDLTFTELSTCFLAGPVLDASFFCHCLEVKPVFVTYPNSLTSVSLIPYIENGDDGSLRYYGFIMCCYLYEG